MKGEITHINMYKNIILESSRKCANGLLVRADNSRDC